MTGRSDHRDLSDDPQRLSAWGRPGGDWAGVRPAMDNPLTWSLPIMRFANITVRLHLVFMIYIVMKISRAALPAQGETVDLTLAAAAMGVLLVVVLAHELGHVLASRFVQGKADEILLWPLGGLATCHLPHRWQAHLATAIGGPLVNLAIILLASPLLVALTGDWRVAMPDPLNPLGYLREYPELSKSWAHIILYMFNAWSMCLLAFNLLPMFPLDGGRIVQAILWSHSGWSASMRTAVRFGLVTGLGLAIFGGILMNWPAVAVAAFGLITCFMTDRQLAFSDSVLALESDEYAIDSSSDLDDDQLDDIDDEIADDDASPSTAPAKARSGSAAPAAPTELDRILQKIVQQGLSSLSAEEQEVLRAETERQRRSGGPER